MIILKKLFFVIFFLLFSHASALNHIERIISFDVTMQVFLDGSMDVVEKITIFSQGKNIKRGIVREIPTVYRDYFGARATIDVALKEVLHNGQPVHYEIKNEHQGKVIEIGTDEKIAPGKHEYSIHYVVNRHVGFFKDYDELYWNVTGSNWRLSMDEIKATVMLPKEIPIDSVLVNGYTGKHGQQGKDFVFEKTEDKIMFHTTRIFDKFEGFTISVSWSKGFIKEPTLSEKISWFFYDNIVLLFLVICFLLLFSILLYLIYLRYFYHEKGTVIPLFYQPDSLTPSQIGYVYYLKFKEQLFAADIVDLAVRGFIEIDYEPAWIKGTYILTKKRNIEENEKNNKEHDQLILSNLFSSSDTIKIENSYKKLLNAAVRSIENYCEQSMKDYIKTHIVFLITSSIIGFVFGLGIFFGKFVGAQFVFLVLVLVALEILIQHFSKFYTEKGRKLKDEIEGFKLFLTTTEIERMNIIGTPPTKTPELYEKYLPYAIALGVEKQWTKQFASVFEKLAKSGKSHIFVWYRGKNFNVSNFGSSFPSAFAAHIRSSGAGGKGSSGGGRGGGGGGGR